MTTGEPDLGLSTSFFGEKCVIIAKSGYGKSYTARVLIEEGLALGHTFLIIDPQDAYLNIEGLAYLDARNIKNPKGLGELLAKSHKSTVIRTKRLGMKEQEELVGVLLASFKKNLEKGVQTVLIDEIHKFAPEGQSTECKDVVRSLFQENRSDGLGCIAITQRPARLDKTILSQADHVLMGRVTSFRDKEAVKNYMDNPDDVEQISKLEKGQFYASGFEQDAPIIVKIRKAKTKHSGENPKNILSEDTTMFSKRVRAHYRGGTTMADQDLINKTVPSTDNLLKFAKLGAYIAVGNAVSRAVGGVVAANVASPLPVVSSRTLAMGATTVLMYAGYRRLPQSWDSVNEFLKYGTAGSAASFLGSLVFDVIAVSPIAVPMVVQNAVSLASGVTMGNVEAAPGGSSADVNTNFA